WSYTPTSALSLGAHVIRLRAVDSAGAFSAVVTRNITVASDTTAPVLAVTAGPADGSTITSATPTWSGGATDTGGAVSTVAVNLDGGLGWTTITCTSCGTASATWSYTPTLTNGAHTVQLRATDAAGNVSTVVSRAV